MPTCCFHGNCINILTTHSHLHSLHPIISFFSISRESPIIPYEKKSINRFLNQWHLKSRWHSSFYGKAVSTNALAVWQKTGSMILALGRGRVHITMSNSSAERVYIGNAQQADQGITHSSFCFPCAQYIMETALGETSFLLTSFGGHRRNSFANFLIWCDLYKMACS